MQYINLNKTLDLGDSITDLLLISIDDQIENVEDKDGIKIIGNIVIGGKVRTIEGEKDFKDNIDLDIFLTYEEIVERNALNISINDFNYNIENEKLLLNISLKLDGLKEIETNFLTEENNEIFQKEEVEENSETEEEKKAYIDLEIDVDRRNEDNGAINDVVICEEQQAENVENGEIKENVDDMKENIIDTNDIEKQEIYENVTCLEKKSLIKTVFSSRKIHEEISWKLHCVKNESTYEEIANKYKVNLNKLISINNNEKLEEGKLIFLPLD